MKPHLFVALCACLLPQLSWSGEIDGRLKRIRETGTLVAAYAETTPPFSYIGPKGPTGFGVELTSRIRDALREELGLKELNIRWNPVTLTTRFPMMTTGVVDIECASTTHTRAREAMVGFSTTFFVSTNGAAVLQASRIDKVEDLAGKRIAVARNTTTEKSLQASSLGFHLVPTRSNRESLLAVTQGDADAYIAAGAIVAGQIIQSKQVEQLRYIELEGGQEAFACMLPKDDPTMKRVVDQAVTRLMASGEMEKLYNRWFMAAIPPYGKRLGIPLNQRNRELYAAPNDQPLE